MAFNMMLLSFDDDGVNVLVLFREVVGIGLAMSSLAVSSL